MTSLRPLRPLSDLSRRGDEEVTDRLQDKGSKTTRCLPYTKSNGERGGPSRVRHQCAVCREKFPVLERKRKEKDFKETVRSLVFDPS